MNFINGLRTFVRNEEGQDLLVRVACGSDRHRCGRGRHRGGRLGQGSVQPDRGGYPVVGFPFETRAGGTFSACPQTYERDP